MGRPRGAGVERRAVSVIIPTNRGGPYLAEAVASLRAQTAAPDEVILVDDGSPSPGLAAIARELGVDYVRKDAGGISSARNAGVARARGTWVAFLDDDDLWHPDRLRAQLSALDGDPDAIASFTGGEYIDAAGRPFGEPWGAPDASNVDMLCGRVASPRITTLLVRRDAYFAVGGCRTRMEPSEDNDLIARLLLRGRFVAVDRPLVSYRRHPSNLTRRALAGRKAGRRSIREMLRTAKRSGDAERLALMRARSRAFVVNSADQNLGDLITAVREREVAYALRVAAWGALAVPVESVRAVRRRVERRRKPA
jgi:glycosyltransferase involved in cell wall biosynthesis